MFRHRCRSAEGHATRSVRPRSNATRCLAALLVILVVSGSTPGARQAFAQEDEAAESKDFAATHVIRAPVAYYKDGPQQGRPADGELPAGTKVRDLGDPSGSYAHVQTDKNLTCYIPRVALKPIN